MRNGVENTSVFYGSVMFYEGLSVPPKINCLVDHLSIGCTCSKKFVLAEKTEITLSQHVERIRQHFGLHFSARSYKMAAIFHAATLSTP